MISQLAPPPMNSDIIQISVDRSEVLEFIVPNSQNESTPQSIVNGMQRPEKETNVISIDELQIAKPSLILLARSQRVSHADRITESQRSSQQYVTVKSS